MSVELHLPDLPEVPLSLGGAATGRAHSDDPSASMDDANRSPGRQGRPANSPLQRRSQRRLLRRLRENLFSYLPLLLMGLLALATWWLVKHSPKPQAVGPPRAPISAPDYTMSRFALERFDAAGRLKLRIQGAELRHFPETDRIEIEDAEILAYAPDGRVTRAKAKRTVGAGDGSEFQLMGGAEVISTDANGQPLLMRSEFLHGWAQLQRVQTHLPVMVQLGNGSELRAAGLDYQHLAGKLEFKGKIRAVLQPRVFKQGDADPTSQVTAQSLSNPLKAR